MPYTQNMLNTRCCRCYQYIYDDDDDDGVDDVTGNGGTGRHTNFKMLISIWHLEGMIYDTKVQELIYSCFLIQLCLSLCTQKDSCYLMDEVIPFSRICIITGY